MNKANADDYWVVNKADVWVTEKKADSVDIGQMAKNVTEEADGVYFCLYGIGGYEWFLLENSKDISCKSPTCKCGALVELEPVFNQAENYRPNATFAAMGNRLYSFGGIDLARRRAEVGEVSYIDTRHPSEGWRVCNNSMPEPRKLAYPIALPDNRVLVLGGFGAEDHPTFAQLYNTSTDSWVALDSHPLSQRIKNVNAHAIIQEGDNTSVIMAVSGRNGCKVLKYNVDMDKWEQIWEDEDVLNGDFYASTVVEGIFYTIHNSIHSSQDLWNLGGYDLEVDPPQRIPVEIRLSAEQTKETWVRTFERDDNMASFESVSLSAIGGSKLGIFWQTTCDQASKIYPWCVHMSIFDMKKETDNGTPKLSAYPIRNVCAHVKAGRIRFRELVWMKVVEQSESIEAGDSSATGSDCILWYN